MGSASLLAVPAVHFHADFALTVNRACCDPARRPGAIAVELGPLIAAAARLWLVELGIGPARSCRLPCMLGLVKRKRYIKLSARERAMELQREKGLDLSRISPTLLHEELGLSTSSVLALSPTDSIVEAMRCACELGVPFYGVDLEEMADPVYPGRILPDPAGGTRDLSEDLLRFAASAPIDPEIDPRRELAMAARLKGLMQRHKRVLFTGGMAHWERIRGHLRDEAVRPSVKGLDAAGLTDPGPFRRTVIHPAMAVAHMDAFPAVALAFERWRRHPLLDAPERYRPIRRGKIFRSLLRKAYRNRFSVSSPAKADVTMRSDWNHCVAFEQIIRGKMLLDLRAHPTLALADSCAQGLLSEEFRAVIRRTFGEFPWVDPRSVQGCGFLRPALAGEGTRNQVVFSETGEGPGEIQVPALLPGGASGSDAFPVPDAWRETAALEQRSGNYRFTWRPWEDLINGLCAMAIAGSFRRRREPALEPYAGQFLDGIDVKATLRAHSRGEEEIWVRDSRFRRGAAPPDLPEGFPVVWIFDEGRGDDRPLEWSTYFEPIDWLANFTGDPPAFRRLLRSPGDGIIDLVTRSCQAVESEANLARTGIGHEILSGLVVFSPIFPTYRQTVSWFQATGASRNPISWCWGAGRNETLIRDLAGRVDPAFRNLRWVDLMICMAIPFSRTILTVVASREYTVSPDIVRVTARRGLTIRMVRLSAFPPELIRRIVHYYVVPGRLDLEGRTEYIPEAERVLGERKDRYRHLVPHAWRTFGIER